MEISVLTPKPWSEYELLDTGGGQRLERFGQFKISRPDPSILWPKGDAKLWENIDAYFDTTSNSWKVKEKFPASWNLKYQDLTFKIKLTPFKHVGIFPEQSVNWEFIKLEVGGRRSDFGNKGSEIRILNLFGYTGAASLVAAKAGAKVTHVDASKPSLNWAHENADLSKTPQDRIRWILDDAQKFVSREIKRGVKYDGIIMDPPVFGHDPQGKAWKFNEDFPELLSSCVKILSDRPLFIIINAYAVTLSSLSLKNTLESTMAGLKGQVEFGELGLKETSLGRTLSTGIFARWSFTKVRAS